MAVIGTIRRNSWILIVFLGLALAAFVVMDLFTGSSRYGLQEMTLGKVGDDKIDYKEFMDMENTLYGGQSTNVYAQRGYLWNHFVNKTILTKEADAAGIGIGKEEIQELQFGPYLSPVISQRFMNPNTGQVDFEQLQNIKTTIAQGGLTEPEQRKYWYYQEQEVLTERLQEKMANIVGGSFYTPNWLAEEMHHATYGTADLEFVKFPFSEMDIAENEIKVTDSEIKSYLSENRSTFVRPAETRIAKYVVFNIAATAADSAAIRGELVALKEGFEQAENDTSFVLENDGELWTEYKGRDAMHPSYADDVLSASLGSVLGPIETDGTVALVKVVDRMRIPDSVSSRHILLTAKTQEEYVAAYQRLDSLKTELEEGRGNFGQLARTMSQGPSGPNGGELGYAAMGAMVKPFNDLIFFNSEVGELGVVATQFGVHLVEVLDKKYISSEMGARLAIISKSYVPSEYTQDSVLQVAQQLVTDARDLESLQNAARDYNLRLQTTKPLEENGFSFGFLGSGSESREMVKWVFDPNTKDGAVAPSVYVFQDPELYYTRQCAIIGLDEVQPAGMPTTDEIKDQIEPILRNKKKGEMFVKEKLGSGYDFKSLAAKFGKEVQEARGVGFNTDIINGIGDEPKIVAEAFRLGQGEFSEPIVASSGVYVIRVKTKVNVPDEENYAQAKENANRTYIQQASAALMKSLKDKAQIEDARSKFF